jgi:hypothetical protein
MEATIADTTAAQIVIPAAHREVAIRYIEAIIRRDPMALVGGQFVDARSRQLWDQFEADYRSLNQGPYSRHGADALRIALGKL